MDSVKLKEKDDTGSCMTMPVPSTSPSSWRSTYFCWRNLFCRLQEVSCVENVCFSSCSSHLRG